MKSKDFDQLRKGAFSFGNSYFGIRWKPANPKGEERRLGIVVPRKVGTAVLRNRIKRVLRESFRQSKNLFPPGDAIVIVREQAGKLKRGDVRRRLEELLKKGLYKRD
ncbi:MAG: ribonuclease P protein component [Deltaproteobacteria bacterium]|nr:ribonuclease P protein component [Deltaproteobacteria bacterium]